MKSRYVMLFISIFLISFSLFWQVKEKLNQMDLADEQRRESITKSSIKSRDFDIPLINENMPEILSSTSVKKIETKETVPVIKRNLDTITSESYLVGNLNTGEIYIENNSSKVFAIASLSKFFTALVADHLINPNQKITITQSMLDAYGDAGGLKLNEIFTPQELIYPLLIESSNDAAEALAQSFGYEKFIEYMNSLAQEIGMGNTHFKDASGLNPGNVSNAKDLFLLSKYYYKNEKGLLDISRKAEFTLATTTNHGFHHLVSINPFVIYEPFIGGKTGRTQTAKESMISLFNYKTSTTTIPISVIILRSEMGEREIDTEKILELFGKNFK